MKTAREIAEEIFYKPATNGKAEQSILEGEEMIKEYAKQALKEAAEKAEIFITRENNKPYSKKGFETFMGTTIEVNKSSILNIELK